MVNLIIKLAVLAIIYMAVTYGGIWEDILLGYLMMFVIISLCLLSPKARRDVRKAVQAKPLELQAYTFAYHIICLSACVALGWYMMAAWYAITMAMYYNTLHAKA
jgi:hypothetical protein